MRSPVRKVSRGALTRCFLRSLFLQAAWNRRGMQNLGFAYAIEPALRSLYADPQARRDALARHLGFFNCHPYVAAGILGGAIHHEERVAAGLEPPGTPVAYKATLQGPLAALGDGFFWNGLRPFCGALGAAGALLAGWPAVIAAVLLYNAVHLTLRVGIFQSGYLQGDAIVGTIGRLSWPALAGRLRLGAAALCGLATTAIAAHAWHVGGPTAFGAALGISALGYGALATGRLPPLAGAYLAAGVGIMAAALLASRLHGGTF